MIPRLFHEGKELAIDAVDGKRKNEEGERALILGASRGIGAAIAQTLGEAGYDLALVARDSKLLAQVEDWRLEVVVYCSGIQANIHSAFVHLRDEKQGGSSTLDRVIDLNFKACVRSIGAVLPTLLNTGKALSSLVQKGATSSQPPAARRYPAIVLISSQITSSYALPGFGVYAASKHAMRGYAASLSREVQHHGISVSLISPGLVFTDLGDEILERFKSLNMVDIQSQDLIQSSDVAAAVLHAVSAPLTANIQDIALQHTRRLTPLLDALVEQPSAPQSSCRFPLRTPQREVAFLTGASRGIGAALAIKLASLGFALALVARSREALQDVAQICFEKGSPEVILFDFDVADITMLENAIHETVGRLGSLSVLICNAGINRRKSAMTAGRRIWDQVLDVNFRSLMHATRTALPYMQMSQRPNGAAIIFISSEAILNEGGFAGLSPYYATKFAISGFAGCVFEDVRQWGIKICIIAPGLTNTDLGVRPGPLEYQGAARMIQPEDVAMSMAYVLSCPKRICPTKIVISPRYPQISQLATGADLLLQHDLAHFSPSLISSRL